MKKISTLIALLFLLHQSLHAQIVEYGIQSGIGQYSMDGLKQLSTSIYKSIPFQAKMISNYPVYFTYSPSLSITYEKSRLGIQPTILSTGSRISSKDYSGEYLFDTKVIAIAPNVFYDVLFYSFQSGYTVYFSSEIGLNFSFLNMKEHLIVDNNTVTDLSYRFYSMNYYIQPGLKLRHDINSKYTFELNAGYSIQIGENPFETNNREMLASEHGDPLGPNWSGLRLGLSIFIKNDWKNY